MTCSRPARFAIAEFALVILSRRSYWKLMPVRSGQGAASASGQVQRLIRQRYLLHSKVSESANQFISYLALDLAAP